MRATPLSHLHQSNGHRVFYRGLKQWGRSVFPELQKRAPQHCIFCFKRNYLCVLDEHRSSLFFSNFPKQTQLSPSRNQKLNPTALNEQLLVKCNKLNGKVYVWSSLLKFNYKNLFVRSLHQLSIVLRMYRNFSLRSIVVPFCKKIWAF